jgi:hypothetical protein
VRFEIELDDCERCRLDYGMEPLLRLEEVVELGLGHISSVRVHRV